MTVTYVYCFSLLELSKSNKLIWYHSICLWIHFSQKHFSQFSNKTTRFFHNFQKKRHDFFTIGLVPDPFTILEKKRCIYKDSSIQPDVCKILPFSNNLGEFHVGLGQISITGIFRLFFCRFISINTIIQQESWVFLLPLQGEY